MSALFSAISVGQDSLKMQARHYKTLCNMYNKPNAKPIHSDVAQVLDLEFKAIGLSLMQMLQKKKTDLQKSLRHIHALEMFEMYVCFYNYLNYCLYICVLNVQWLNNCAQ